MSGVWGSDFGDWVLGARVSGFGFGARGSVCEDRVLDGPASGERDSKASQIGTTCGTASDSVKYLLADGGELPAVGPLLIKHI